MASFIPEVKNLAVFVGYFTVINEMSEAVSYKTLKQLFNPRKHFFDPSAPVPSLATRIWSVVCSGTRITSALFVCLLYSLISSVTIARLCAIGLKGPIKRCPNVQLALVVSTCLAFYVGIKQYVSEESRMGAWAGRAVQAIGKGAFVGALFQFNPLLGFVSQNGLNLAEYYRRQQENEKISISIILDEKDKTLFDQHQRLTNSINRLFNDNEFSADEGAEFLDQDKFLSKIDNIDPENLQAVRERLSKGKFLDLLPPIEVPSWGALSFDAKINMAFLLTGIYIFTTPEESKIQKEEWFKKFVVLCQENASLQERKQLALDYLCSY